MSIFTFMTTTLLVLSYQAESYTEAVKQLREDGYVVAYPI